MVAKRSSGNVTQASRATAAEQVTQTAPQLTHAKEAPMMILGEDANEPTAVAVPLGLIPSSNFQSCAKAEPDQSL